MGTATGDQEFGEDRWFSTHAAAAYLGLKCRTVHKLIDDGDLPAYRFGRVLRVKRLDIERYIEAQRIQPGSLSHLYTDDASR